MIRVRIPATTANLGPGFDCMGLALDLWNTFELHLGGHQFLVHSDGEGVGSLPPDEKNLVVQVMQQELIHLGQTLIKGARIVAHNEVPVISGLGSSSTATLAGVLFAHAIKNANEGIDPSDLDYDTVLERAVAIEGHGDNVAPALLGGFIVVMPDESGVLTQRVPHVPIRTVVCVPDFHFPTHAARAALPNSYSKDDAVYNIGRAMLVSEALRSGDDAMLRRAMNDRIHEPYRLPQIPGALEAKSAALEAGAVAVALSGAGPGIVAFARGLYDEIGLAMKAAFHREGLVSRYWILDVSPAGTHISRLPV
jgi:homoserine kinase